MSVTDTSPVPGDTLFVRARGCEPGSLVRIFIGGRKVRVGRANDNGNMGRNVRIPPRAKAGDRTLRIVCVNDVSDAPREVITQNFKVRQQAETEETLEPGTRVTVSGDGCIGGGPVRVYLDRDQRRTVSADDGGGFSTFFRVPDGTPAGLRRVRAACGQVYPPGSTRTIDTYIRVGS